MIKFRLYFDKDQETEWLNGLVQEGWALKRFFAGFYSFERCEPGQYTYQIDLGPATGDYREFMQETGAEIVQTWGLWIILRKPSCEGPFELYSDVESSITHYTKIRRMFRAVTALELLCLFVEIWGAAHGSAAAFAFMWVIAAMIFALVGIIFKTNNIIYRLQEQQGASPSGKRCASMSPLLPCGLLLNACALLLGDSVPGPVKLTIQTAAILLMLAGIVRSHRTR